MKIKITTIREMPDDFLKHWLDAVENLSERVIDREAFLKDGEYTHNIVTEIGDGRITESSTHYEIIKGDE